MLQLLDRKAEARDAFCFGIVLISAAIAKYFSGHPIVGVMEPLFVFAIMVGSNGI